MAKIPFTYTVNDNTIRLTFNAEGWTELDTKILEHFAHRVNEGHITPSEPIAKGLAFYTLSRLDSAEDNLSFLKMLNVDIK